MKYRSDAMAAIHETMEGLHNAGAINKQTMRRFDDACLTPIRPLKPKATVSAVKIKLSGRTLAIRAHPRNPR